VKRAEVKKKGLRLVVTDLGIIGFFCALTSKIKGADVMLISTDSEGRRLATAGIFGINTTFSYRYPNSFESDI